MSHRDLWVAVIHQALKDAIADPHEGAAATNTRPSFHESRAARDWFDVGGRDFIRACCNAELDPAFVRDGALRLIASVDQGKKLSTPDIDKSEHLISPEGVSCST